MLLAVVAFRAGLSGEAVARTVGRLADRVRGRHPEVKHIFIQPAVRS